MNEKLIDIHLSVKESENVLIAQLIFLNKGSNKVYLDARTICLDGRFTRNVFNILEENGDKVRYKGMMIKRDVLPEDFIAINAGEKTTVNVILNEGYNLIKDKKYNIQYSVYNPPYLEIQKLTKIESNQVEVVY